MLRPLLAAWVFLVPLPAGADEPGFVRMFDGRTLEGWDGDPVYWRVENGCIVGEITPETLVKRNTFLIWKDAKPGDFELRLEYRITGEGNSGVNYRSERMDDHPFALTGYQADIDGKNRYTGQNYEERGRTTLAHIGQVTTIPSLDTPMNDDAWRMLVLKNSWSPAIVVKSLGTKEELTHGIKSGDWNQMRIVARGNRLKHYVNGMLLSDVTDLDPIRGRRSGFIGVQVHVGPPMKVEYREIMLKTFDDRGGVSDSGASDP